jgi:pimeloyl-ACP methyl ester carboxylesterase
VSQLQSASLAVGVDAARRDIAMLRRPGAAPGLFWLGGFRSDMDGAKAGALDALGERLGLAVTRFDYSGHGRSGGDFIDGTISRWLEEAEAVFALTAGPQIVIGSSMGGWLALLLNRALRRRGDTSVAGLVLIAPAIDMTADLMRAGFTRAERTAMKRDGVVSQPSAYGEPYVLTRALIEDGDRHRLFGGVIETGCPVHVLQGGRDRDVPQAHALKLVSHLLLDPVTVTLIPDGDHRLSRPGDIARLDAVVRRMADEVRGHAEEQASLF